MATEGEGGFGETALHSCLYPRVQIQRLWLSIVEKTMPPIDATIDDSYMDEFVRLFKTAPAVSPCGGLVMDRHAVEEIVKNHAQAVDSSTDSELGSNFAAAVQGGVYQILAWRKRKQP